MTKSRKSNPRLPGLRLEPVPAVKVSRKRKASVVESAIHQGSGGEPANKTVRFSNVAAGSSSPRPGQVG